MNKYNIKYNPFARFGFAPAESSSGDSGSSVPTPPTDGKTHANITLTAVTGLDITLYLTKSDTSEMTIDWGDGSTPDTFTDDGAFNTGAHTYASAGDYEITIWISSGTGTYSFGNNSYGVSFAGGGGDGCQEERNTLRQLFIGSNVVSINDYAFYSCKSLKDVFIPDNITVIGNYGFFGCYSLCNINANCITSLGDYGIRNCYGVRSISIGSNIGTIGTMAFSSSYIAEYYKILASTPPTLSDANAFQNINSIAKIYVPDASVDDYKTATNWITYADYIYPLSDLEG